MRRGCRGSRRSAIALACILGAPAAAAGQEEPENPYFELEDLAPEEPRLSLHGVLDLTLIQFEDSRNLDDYPTLRLTPLEPEVIGRYRLAEEHELVAEVELDGLDWNFELEQLAYRYLPGESVGAAAGIVVIPFGIERFYSNAAQNPFVDRPSPFRRIYPGSYSDLGLLGWGSTRGTWGLQLEAALTRGLTGPDRTDRSEPFDPIEWAQPSGRLALAGPEGLEIGVSGLASREISGSGELWLAGVDFSWRHETTVLRAEWVFGSVDAEGRDFDRSGGYIELYRRFPGAIPWGEALEGAIRYDDVDEDDTVEDENDARRLALALAWVIDARWRLKTEVLIAREDGEQIANDGRFIQLEYHF